MDDARTPFGEEDAEDLYEHAPCGLLSTLLDGTILRINQTLLDWMGLRRDDVVGRRRFQDLLTPGGRIYYETHYAPLLRMQGNVREIAVDLVRAGDRSMPALVNSAVKRAADGQPVVIRTAIFRATERRTYERELLAARLRAEHSEATARTLAKTLQSTFIPPAPPVIPGLDIGVVFRPSGAGNEVGGDFYDIFETGPGRWALVVGDVCGKGAEAATLTALARYTVRAAAIRTRRPRAVLERLNDALLRDRSDRFCTVLFATMRPEVSGRFRLRISSGGHPLPLHVAPSGKVRGLGRHGTVLGVVEDPDLADTTGDLGPGDVVVLYTDGVTEARRDSDLFGSERLAAVVAERRHDDAATIARVIVDRVTEFGGSAPRDDIVVVVLKVAAAR